MARLLAAPEPQFRPWDYLVACYGRTSQELQTLPSLRNKDFSQRLSGTLTGLKQLLVSYSGLLLTMSMFPQVVSRSIP